MRLFVDKFFEFRLLLKELNKEAVLVFKNISRYLIFKNISRYLAKCND